MPSRTSKKTFDEEMQGGLGFIGFVGLAFTGLM